MTKKKKKITPKRPSATPKRPSLAETLGLRRIADFFLSERLHFILGLLVFAVAVFMTWSFVSYFSTGPADQSYIEHLQADELANEHHQFLNSCGSFGAYTAWFFIKRCFGLAAFVVPVFLFLLAFRLMRAYKAPLLKWFFALTLLLVWASLAFAKFLAPLFTDIHFAPGGDHGLYVTRWIEGYVGEPGVVALLGIVAIVFLIYVSSETIYVIRKLLNPVKIFTDRVKFEVSDNSEGVSAEDSYINNIKDTDEERRTFDNPETEAIEFEVDAPKPDDAEPVVIPPSKPDTDKPKGGDIEMEVTVAEGGEQLTDDVTDCPPSKEPELEPYDPKRDLENYHYPTLELLKAYEDDARPYIDMDEQKANKDRIIQVLRNFGIEISSIKATVGPTITLYEITPAQGVRIAKIRNLEDDIALSLKALGIRIIAPIPGKGTIGIEVPNAKKNIVSMRSILDSKKFQETKAVVSMRSVLDSKTFQESKMELPCAMGKTITNEVFMFDLAKAPHLLVAGATGQGKSVGLNAILTSLLYKKHPAELKIVLVDPKMVEFSIYSKIANHFLAKVPDDDASPIITDTKKVVRTLNSLCVEMDARYELLMAAGERNIKDYNRKFIERRLNPERGHRFMPYIVVVIDEYGDLIMTAGKEIELPIARIAQKARAVGIHMIIATQRPTTNIITGTIKANFPARIAFKVSQGIDSKTILDRMGAQQLIGRGDMLYLQGNDPIRVQCAFVDTPEVDDINKYIADQQGYLEPYELPEPIMADDDAGGGSNEADLSHLDPMFDDAARLIVSSQQGSTSLIQRKFSIGYNRAGRLMDQLEKAGVVGQAHGSKPRDVLIQDEMTLENLINSLR